MDDIRETMNIVITDLYQTSQDKFERLMLSVVNAISQTSSRKGLVRADLLNIIKGMHQGFQWSSILGSYLALMHWYK